MIFKNNLIKGTFILTLAGLFSRVIGFFYKVFLSRVIGAEGIGLYQLVFPLYMLAYGITVSGIQTAISRLVSARISSQDRHGARRILFLGILLSVGISLPVSGIFFLFCQPLAAFYLKNAATARLLAVMAFAIPFGSFHACVDGYYFGIQRTFVPAIRQLLEQGIRFLLLLFICWRFPRTITPLTAVVILVLEEIFAAFFSFATILIHVVIPAFSAKHPSISSSCKKKLSHDLSDLLHMALPLSGNRLLICILQSLEASLLPLSLQLSGYSISVSLKIYGILSGMALPMILFPTAITSSLATMLLPSVSSAQASHSGSHIQKLVHKSILSCLGMGIFFSLFFLLAGKPVTSFLFQNELSGYYVQSFAFVCPLLYLNPVLFSVLNGLGESTSVFFYSLSSLFLRLIFVLFVVPMLGISGYFSGLFFSQLLCCILCMWKIHRLPCFSST